jgi:hypothetical protein
MGDHPDHPVHARSGWSAWTGSLFSTRAKTCQIRQTAKRVCATIKARVLSELARLSGCRNGRNGGVKSGQADLYPKSDGSGYGKLDRGNDGGKPTFSAGQQGGF